MNPAVPDTKGGVGTSFKGTARYLLHDKDAGTDERVAWTETRHMATDDPELAWRVMAATAKDAPRLKEEHHARVQAELPEDERTPYKASKGSHNHVFHYALTWHEDEAPYLTRDEMMRCAFGSIRELKAEGLQALIVCHHEPKADDRHLQNPHVHIMLNRVDPETGRIRAIDSNSERKLSNWALKYSRDFRERNGTIDHAPKREENAMKRANRVPYEAERRVKRADYERMKKAVTRDDGREIRLDPVRAQALKKQEAEADHRLARDERAMTVRHRKQWAGLVADHNARKAHINADADATKNLAKRQISQGYEPKWRALRDAQEAEKRAMVDKERSLAGKVENTVSALRSIWRDRRETDTRQVVSDTFAAVGSQGGRMAALEKAHRKAQSALAGSQKADTRVALSDIEARRKAAISENYERHGREREQLKFTQAGDRAKARAAWRARGEAKTAAWRSLAASERHRQDYRAAADPPARAVSRSAGDDRAAKSAPDKPKRSRSRRRRTRE